MNLRPQLKKLKQSISQYQKTRFSCFQTNLQGMQKQLEHQQLVKKKVEQEQMLIIEKVLS